MYTIGGGILENDEFISKLSIIVNSFPKVKNNKKVEYYNIPAGFDIETSSFYQDGEKRSCMYLWQLGIYNIVTIGRTYESFLEILGKITEILNLSDNLKLVIYVQNLPYEFQFIRKLIEWEKVFLLGDRKPFYELTYGIEFKCSLKLSGGKSLDKMGEELVKYKVKKAVGNLDYNKIRHSTTPLDSSELYYGEMDIRVILCYIQEKIEQDGDITKIPLTNTGYVRNFCRKKCFARWKKYHELMASLVLTPGEYSQLKRAFAGGFTHASAFWVRKHIKDVWSKDFTSSYPACMVLEMFPMSPPKLWTKELNRDTLEYMLAKYCCMFEVEIFNIHPIIFHEHPISKSHCYIALNCVTDNGRIVTADRIKLTVTEQDFFTIREFYEWDEIIISDFRYFEKWYLPKAFIMAILEMYKNKTTLKGTEDIINYMISKNMINAAYGMIVTNPLRDEIEYIDGGYVKKKPDIEHALEKYNKNVRRFIYYAWGVWVTAYARRNLFSGIRELGNDYIYSDTDSLKYINSHLHEKYFEEYNANILSKIQRISDYYKIPIEMFSPLTKKGVKKTIGLWDDEGKYDEFKTLGAKRYLTLKLVPWDFSKIKLKRNKRNGKYRITRRCDKRYKVNKRKEYELTVAGVNKKSAMRYLQTLGNPFEFFDDGLVVPSKWSKRLCLTYIDEETQGIVVDYNGEPGEYHELSCVHMEPTKYELGMSAEFVKYLRGIENWDE